MAEVTIRDLRNHGGDVIDRVQAGEHLTITRGGRPVAELRPLPAQTLAAGVLLQRWSRVPLVDWRRLRSQLDRVLESSV